MTIAYSAIVFLTFVNVLAFIVRIVKRRAFWPTYPIVVIDLLLTLICVGFIVFVTFWATIAAVLAAAVTVMDFRRRRAIGRSY